MRFSVDLGQFLIKIWDAAAGQLKHLLRPKPRIEKLEKSRAELKAKEADISNSISLAEIEGQTSSNQIQLWKSEVRELEIKAAAIEQDFERRRCLGGSSWNCFSVNRRTAKRLDEIDKLLTRADATPIAIKPLPPAVVQIPITDSTFGMEAYMERTLCHIASANAAGAGVIGVYGMGGVGKTILLRSINNHRDVAVFDHVIWAVASRECNMKRLQMAIAKRLNLSLDEDDSEEDSATKLQSLLRNKDCLLLLDDLWRPLDLAKLGMAHAPLGQGEQKRKVVVFTTRHEQVCGGMKADNKIEIKCLGPEHAWELFRRNAGEDAIGSDHGINRIAHLITKECAGLPLALVTVGIAMSTKKSWEAWNDALTQMKHSQMPKVTGTNDADPMFSAFKLSYDSLEDDDTRGRLLSCVLWPEDHSIDKDKLIECWMGLSLIDEVCAIHRAYNRGHSHIETLKAACLLEPGDDDEQSEVKMHDVIRDMALWMASGCGMNRFKWIVRAGVTTSQTLEEGGWYEAERVSLMHNHFNSLPNQLSTCSKLSVLMLQFDYAIEEIPGRLIQAMRALTYLDLERTQIRELPKEIGMLPLLQHLNLSYTPIRELPAELGYLVKLNYLLLRHTSNLTVVTKGTISNLSSLKLLDLRGSGYMDCWDELEGLKGYQRSIGIDIRKAATLQRLCSLSHLSTWRLNVESLEDSTNLNQLMDDIMRSSNVRQCMEQLRIVNVGMEELLIGTEHEEIGGLECLKYLQLSNLHLLREIRIEVQSQIVFPNLRELNIYSCRRLRNVNWALQLPSLSSLIISLCESIEDLISDEGELSSSSMGLRGSSSMGLRRIMLFGLHKLNMISPRSLRFPYLEDIEVQYCPNLRKLPFENRISVSKLKVIRGQQTWWDSLEWEEISIKHSFSSLFKATC